MCLLRWRRFFYRVSRKVIKWVLGMRGILVVIVRRVMSLYEVGKDKC